MDEPKINEAQRVEALLDLYKHQMEQFRNTRELEWKANLAIWTLLAGAVYVLPKEPVHISHCVAAVALISAIVVHAFWLRKVHDSEAYDKVLWSRYRAEALRLIRGTATVGEDETPYKESMRPTIWFWLEVGVTALLCASLLMFLPT
jgi:hypothetical protein